MFLHYNVKKIHKYIANSFFIKQQIVFVQYIIIDFFPLCLNKYKLDDNTLF